ncbi:unnamed protein product [Aspergillus oryzae]|nr:unnamed protein product [Aspergillus oryzae]GMF96950.1 unnamed protein product [Aspergillus oryzae]
MGLEMNIKIIKIQNLRRHRAGRMPRFRPWVRPVQHFSSWLGLHLPESPESPESPPSQLSQGAAVTAVAKATRAITERNCILIDDDFDVEEDEKCRSVLFSEKEDEAEKEAVCLMKKTMDSVGSQAVFIAALVQRDARGILFAFCLT